MTNRRPIEVQFEDPNPKKWCHPLREEVFAAMMAKGNVQEVTKVFGEGSIFSPLLFGKFFDPSDAFPIWEFEPDVLLSKPLTSSNNRRAVDWFQAEKENVFRAELPGIMKNRLEVCVERGKVVEIRGQWKQQKDPNLPKDWKCQHWWEHGCVRRLELPENADFTKTEAFLVNDALLELRIPKPPPDAYNMPQVLSTE